MNPPRNEDSKTLIAASRDIRDKFVHLEYLWTSKGVEESSRLRFLNELERFELWAVNIGVYSLGHSSLDYRFRDAPRFLDFTRKLLKDLRAYLEQITVVVLNTGKEPEDPLWTSDEEFVRRNDHESIEETKRVSIPASGNLPGQSLANDQTEGSSHNEPESLSRSSSVESFGSYRDDNLLQFTLDNLSDSLDRLYRLSIKIRNPRTRIGTSKASGFKKIDEDTGIDLIEVYASLDKAHLQELFAHFQSKSPAEFRNHYLVNRFTSANCRRRQQFGHWQRHHLKLKQYDQYHAGNASEEQGIERTAELPNPWSNAEIGTVLSEPTTATTLLPRVVNLDDDKSTISNHTMMIDDADMKDNSVQIPSLPDSLKSKKEFLCPYCFTICSHKTMQKAAWELHVFRDLRPYVCTYPVCQQSEQQYDTFHDWIAHEVQAHKLDNITRGHEENILSGQSGPEGSPEALNLANFEKNCPICLQTFQTKELRQAHTASHLRRVALFALPRSPNFGGTEDDEDTVSGKANASLQSQSSIIDDIEGVSGQSSIESNPLTEEYALHASIQADTELENPSEENSGITASDLRQLELQDVHERSLNEADISEKFGQYGKWRHRDRHGRTFLARACTNGELEQVKAYYDELPSDLNLSDNAGNTPLQIAALSGFTEVVQFLLSKGCEINTKNIDNDTPLIDAVENGHLDVIKLLLDNNADPRSRNAKGEEPYELVSSDAENYEQIRKLLSDAQIKQDRRQQRKDRVRKDSTSRISSAPDASSSNKLEPQEISERSLATAKFIANLKNDSPPNKAVNESRSKPNQKREPISDEETLEIARREFDKAKQLSKETGCTLDLGHNSIARIPEELVDLIKDYVERLSLSHNVLASLPLKFEQCSHLHYLNIRYNSFRKIPQAIYALPRLETLDVSKNKLTRIDGAIGNLRSLRVLSLKTNRIKDLPLSIKDLANIRIILLENNPLIPPLKNIVEKENNEADKHENEHARDLVITSEVKRYLQQKLYETSEIEGRLRKGPLTTREYEQNEKYEK